jgi:hypothetical protein
MPLGWYFAEQWRRFFGNNWVEQLCDKFIIQDRFLKNFANELPVVSQHSLRILQLSFLKNLANKLPVVATLLLSFLKNFASKLLVVSQHSQNFATEVPQELC